MNLLRPSFLFSVVFIVNTLYLTAQKPSYRDEYQQGKEWFDEGLYREALQAFSGLPTSKEIPQNSLYLYLARCYKQLGRPLQAKAAYLQLKNIQAIHYQELALACHSAQQFDTAAYYYKRYLERTPENARGRETLKLRLRQCEWGPKWYELAGQTARAVVQPMGAEVNSQNDDYGAYLHPQYYYNLFFSSDRRYLQSNLFQSVFSIGNWTTGDTALAFFNDPLRSEKMAGFYGKSPSMIVFQRNDSLFVENPQTQSKRDRFIPFASELLDAEGEELDYQWFSDSMVLFSSNRAGGYGGFDLYYSVLTDTGWAQPRNLGAAVNGRYDERAPFLELDGRTLRFSAQNPMGIGGFDFYESSFSDSSLQWQPPTLLLPPFSSCDDDLHWISHPEGWQVFFASDRAGGEGGLDLYTAYLLRPQQYELGKPNFADYWAGKAQRDTTQQIIVEKPLQIKQFSLTTVFYPRSTGVWLGDKALVNALDTLLRSYPEARVVLDAHTDNSGVRDYDAFLSLQQADKLALRLVERGAKPHQILVRGCGQTYPIALNNTANGSVNMSGRNMNQRIEPLVLLGDRMPVKIQYNYPEVSEIMDTAAGATYRQRLDGITYKVRVLQSANYNSHAVFALSPHFTIERQPQQTKADFYIGLAPNFAEANQLLEQVRQQGIKDSRIVAYWNGFPMRLDEVRQRIPRFSDLQLYLQAVEREGWAD